MGRRILNGEMPTSSLVKEIAEEDVITSEEMMEKVKKLASRPSMDSMDPEIAEKIMNGEIGEFVDSINSDMAARILKSKKVLEEQEELEMGRRILDGGLPKGHFPPQS